MLIGSASRYIAGRAAMQTVYWRASKTGSPKLVKTGRILSFGRKSGETPVDKTESLDSLLKYLGTKTSSTQ